jgi:hypothetical protein
VELSTVQLKLFSLEGREVMTIADENFSEGTHQLTINRQSLSAGIYFLQLKTSSSTITKKVVIE